MKFNANYIFQITRSWYDRVTSFVFNFHPGTGLILWNRNENPKIELDVEFVQSLIARMMPTFSSIGITTDDEETRVYGVKSCDQDNGEVTIELQELKFKDGLLVEVVPLGEEGTFVFESAYA